MSGPDGHDYAAAAVEYAGRAQLAVSPHERDTALKLAELYVRLREDETKQALIAQRARELDAQVSRRPRPSRNQEDCDD